MDAQEIEGDEQAGSSSEGMSGPSSSHHYSTVASTHSSTALSVRRVSRAPAPSTHTVHPPTTAGSTSDRAQINRRLLSSQVERLEPYDAADSSRQSLDGSPVFSRSQLYDFGTPDSTAPATPPPAYESFEDESHRKPNGPETTDRSQQNPGESFCRVGYMVKADLEVQPILITFDTQSGENLLSVEMADKLGFGLMECDDVILCPLRTKSAINSEIIATRKVTVDWYFQSEAATYTTTFLVVDMKDYDAILGKHCLAEYGIVTVFDRGPGHGGILRQPNE
ncbi:hypothetical protein FE257_001083 [Aspergillus nanangensis]|uniref:Uncharacterized protein n=1 Tax=Aspergillus nanangensis TaxID=2582783 RepID=A0AAD4CTY8_ASPNN|nr:hypothetical protein FE257_001083 [Aspergillus nanangensis]